MLRSSGNVGKYIGGYNITLELASNSSSRIFLGESVSPERHNVAIKRFYATQITSRQEQENFLQEASELKQFNHPYILLLLSADVIKGTPYLISEYAADGSLYGRLQRIAPQPMSQTEAITILSQIGQALQYAHQKNRPHGNLKPQNILFNSNGDALLADFKMNSLALLSTSSIVSVPSGNLAYLPPDQSENSVSKENDQYALGCIAYEMFTGRKPFTTPSQKQPGAFYKTRALIAPRKLNPTLPAHIEKAILKAMAKEPSQRFKSVLDFVKALGNPGVLTVPEDIPASPMPVKNTPPTLPNLVPLQDNKSLPVLAGLKVASAGSTTLGQFRARAALWRNTFSSVTNLAVLPRPKWATSRTPSKGKLKARRSFLIAGTFLLVTLIAAGTIFAFSSLRSMTGGQGINNGGTVPAGTATIIQTQTSSQQAIPSTAPTRTATKSVGGINIPPQPTQPVQKQPTTIVPTPKATTGVKTPPTTAPTQPPPSNTLSVTPANFNVTNCILNGNGTYTCLAVLSLGAAAGTSQNWYTYSIGVGTSFKPSSGTIAPGQIINIKIVVFDTCTKPGTFVFVGTKTNVTSTWNC